MQGINTQNQWHNNKLIREHTIQQTQHHQQKSLTLTIVKTLLIDNWAAGQQVEWMKDYNHTWLLLGWCLFRPDMAVNMLLNM